MIVLLIAVFISTFGYAVASRMAGESRFLLAGIAIGVIVSLPAALLAAVVATRVSNSGRQVSAEPEPVVRQPASGTPPIVIVNPGQGGRVSRRAPYVEPLLEPPPPRTFTIVGDDTGNHE
jgi:hypothetical protein